VSDTPEPADHQPGTTQLAVLRQIRDAQQRTNALLTIALILLTVVAVLILLLVIMWNAGLTITDIDAPLGV